MSAAHVTVDLDDTEGLLNADRDGLLRGAAMAGAQVRAVASALAEGALDSVADGQRPRSLVWVGGRGAADSAGAILAAALGGVASSRLSSRRKCRHGSGPSTWSLWPATMRVTRRWWRRLRWGSAAAPELWSPRPSRGRCGTPRRRVAVFEPA